MLWKRKKEEKKEPPVQLRSWQVPQEFVEEVLDLWDTGADSENYGDKYRLWKKLYQAIPELPRDVLLRIRSRAWNLVVVEEYQR